MPGFVNPDEQESRQELYRDLLSHLNTTIWGSPSILPASESGQYTLDMNPVEAFDKSKNPEGAIYAEPQLNWTESAVNKGPGWQSRTLDWLAGRLGKAPKHATMESWIAKAKQAGLPIEEREKLTDLLQSGQGYYNPKDRIGAEALSFMAEKEGLPTQGIYTQELSKGLSNRYTAVSRKADETLISLIAPTYNPTKYTRLKEIAQRNPKLYDTLREIRQKFDEKAMEARPRWSQFNLEEVTSPREILYKTKGSTYKNPDIETHYEDLGEGLQWHQREGKLRFPEGESTHLSEQQSDLMAEWIKKISTRKKEDEFGTWVRNQGLKYKEHYKDEMPKPTLHENWYKTGFRDLVNRAVQEDSKFVSWDSAAVQKQRWPAGEGTDKFFDTHYDQKLVNFVKKEYGVTPEKINVSTKVMGKVTLMSPRGENIERPTTSLTMWRVKPEEAPSDNLRWTVGDPDFGTYGHYGTYQEAKEALDWLIRRGVETKNNEVWRIPITDDIKRKVLLEGQYFSEAGPRRPYDIG